MNFSHSNVIIASSKLNISYITLLNHNGANTGLVMSVFEELQSDVYISYKQVTILRNVSRNIWFSLAKRGPSEFEVQLIT